MKSRFYLLAFAVLFLSAGAAHAQRPGQIVIVNNVALKTAETLTFQIYKTGGKKPALLKNEMIVASEDCTNGCGTPSAAVDAAPGEYRVQVFGGVALDSATVTFPVHSSDEFVWMISNRASPPHIRVKAPGLKIETNQGPFRLDLVAYTKGAALNLPPQAPAAQKRKKSLWPFKPNTADTFIRNN